MSSIWFFCRSSLTPPHAASGHAVAATTPTIAFKLPTLLRLSSSHASTTALQTSRLRDAKPFTMSPSCCKNSITAVLQNQCPYAAVVHRLCHLLQICFFFSYFYRDFKLFVLLVLEVAIFNSNHLVYEIC